MDAGRGADFHAFLHDWITELGRTLNRGLLPGGVFATILGKVDVRLKSVLLQGDSSDFDVDCAMERVRRLAGPFLPRKRHL